LFCYVFVIVFRRILVSQDTSTTVYKWTAVVRFGFSKVDVIFVFPVCP